MLYGFPPGVGATGTAALLNIPKVSINAACLRKHCSAAAYRAQT